MKGIRVRSLRPRRLSGRRSRWIGSSDTAAVLHARRGRLSGSAHRQETRSSSCSARTDDNRRRGTGSTTAPSRCRWPGVSRTWPTTPSTVPAPRSHDGRNASSCVRPEPGWTIALGPRHSNVHERERCLAPAPVVEEERLTSVSAGLRHRASSVRWCTDECSLGSLSDHPLAVRRNRPGVDPVDPPGSFRQRQVNPRAELSRGTRLTSAVDA